MLQKLFSSKRVIVVVCAGALVVFNERFGLTLSQWQLDNLVNLVSALVLGDSVREIIPKIKAILTPSTPSQPS